MAENQITTIEADEETEAKMQQAYAHVRNIRKYHRAVTLATETRMSCEKDLQSAKTAEEAAIAKFMEASRKLAAM